MALPGLLPSTDFKKEYNFYWQISLETSLLRDFVSSIRHKTNVNWNEFQKIAAVEMLYVSQLAESINLPDDEIDIEYYDVGSVKLPVAKAYKLPDIQVTYLEDTLNTVYNFHKYWMNCVKSEGGFDMNTIRPWCMQGLYLPLDNSTTQFVAITEELTRRFNASAVINKITGNSGSHVYNPVTDGLADTALSLRGLQIYPLIFPTKISRGTMNKGGQGLAKVTVNYIRFPLMKNKSSNCLYLGEDGKWSSTPLPPGSS